MASPYPRLHRLGQACRRIRSRGIVVQARRDSTEFPDIGHTYTTPSGRTVRILLWSHYRIVYVRQPPDEVRILGVFHGAMDLKQYVP